MEDIKYAIFDVDGTLTDSNPIWTTCGGAFLMMCGIMVSQDETFASIDYHDDIPKMIEKFNLPLTYDDVLAQLMKILEYYYFNIAAVKPGVKEFLEKLQNKGVEMCIITATNQYLIEAALERNGIRKYFSKIYSTTDIGIHKDKPEIFEMAREYINAPKSSDVFVFEDALYSIKTAKSAGFKIIAIEDDWSANDRDEIKNISDYYIKGYDEIYNILNLN